MALAYAVLGPLVVTRGGVDLDLGAPKQRTVLAVLLLNRGRVVSTDRLVDAAWPEDAPPSAVPSLQVYLSNLRRLLRGPDPDGAGRVTPLARQAPGYRLDVGGARVDLDDFLVATHEQAEAVARTDWAAALAAWDRARVLWRGTLLADLADEPWVRAEATLLEERRTRSRAHAVLSHAATGDLGTALELARGLQTDHPWRDDMAVLLMRVLARAGRTTEALEVHRAYATGLADDLGLDPGAELGDLQAAVLRGDRELASWPAGSSTSGTAILRSPDPRPPDLTRPVPGGFVGRTAPLAALDAALAEGRRGRSTWAVVSGPPGIGKTRLVQQAVDRAALAGAAVVWGRCLEEEGAPAWWPWRAVVRALGADPAGLLAPPAEADADTARFLVYERLDDLLRRSAAAGPLVVVLDDLQWSDGTSLAALASLVVTLQDVPVTFLVTLRDTDRRAATLDALHRVLAAIGRASSARELVLGPLAPAEVADVVATVNGEDLSPDAAVALTERTGGNPLFVREYARLPPSDRLSSVLPSAVRSVLGRRLAALDPEVLELVRAAAVIGERVDLPLLAAVVRLDPDRVADLLDGAADEGIIGPVPGGAGYGFSHALLREEVLAGLSPVRRQRLHLRVADALGAGLLGSSEEPVTRRAYHLVAALPLGDAVKAVRACTAAAARAEEQWSYETAVQWRETALTAWDAAPGTHPDPDERDDLLVALVQALSRSGRGQTLIDLVERSLADAETAGRTGTVGRLCSALLRSAGSWPWTSGGDDSRPLLDRLGSLQRFVEADPAARARLLAAYGVGNGYHPDAAVPDALTSRAIAAAEELGDDDVLADALLGRVLTYVGVSGHAAECDELLARLVALNHAQHDVDVVLRHTASTMSRILLGDVAGAAHHLERGAAEADRLRLSLLRAQLRWAEFGLAAWRGAANAQELLALAAEAHRRTELYEAGVVELATNLLGLDTGKVFPWSALDDSQEHLTWGAVAADFADDRERAEELVARRLAVRAPTVWFTLGHLAVLAHVVADLGLVQHAPTLVQRLEPDRDHIAMVGQIASCGPVALALARLRTVLGDLDAAADDLALATDLARRNDGLSALLRCALAEAELDRAAGRPLRLDQLAETAAIARRLGLDRIVVRATTLMGHPAADAADRVVG